MNHNGSRVYGRHLRKAEFSLAKKQHFLFLKPSGNKPLNHKRKVLSFSPRNVPGSGKTPYFQADPILNSDSDGPPLFPGHIRSCSNKYQRDQKSWMLSTLSVIVAFI